MAGLRGEDKMGLVGYHSGQECPTLKQTTPARNQAAGAGPSPARPSRQRRADIILAHLWCDRV